MKKLSGVDRFDNPKMTKRNSKVWLVLYLEEIHTEQVNYDQIL